MQPILIFVWVCLSLSGCSSQETTDSWTQPSTDAATGTREIEWDTTSLPMTTSGDAHLRENQISPRSNADYPSIFANEWGPVMMPMKFPSYGDRIYNHKSRFDMRDTVKLYPILRRPDAYSTNWTHTTTPDDVKYPLTPGYFPFSPPVLFYPEMGPNEPEGGRYTGSGDSVVDAQASKLPEGSETENISASSPAPAFYRSPYARLDAVPENNPFPFLNYPPPNFFLRNRGDVRDPDNAVPTSPFAVPPGFYPPAGPQMYPVVNVFVRPPYVDREPGLVPQEILADRRDVLPPPKQGAETATNLPTVAPIPLQSVPPATLPRGPLPPNPFPFGYLPPGLPPPFPLTPGLLPPPTAVLPNIPVPSEDKLLVGSSPRGPLEPIKPPGVPADSSPTTDSIPDVVNVEVIPTDTTKPEDENINVARTPYEFGYDMNDGRGTGQHRQESADEAGVVTGSYGYKDPFGVYRLVNYIADKNGFRAFIKSNEPGIANPGSANVVVLAERPPIQTIAEGLRRSDINVEVVNEPEDLEVEASETK